MTSRGTVTLIPPTRVIRERVGDAPTSTASRSCSSSRRRRKRPPRCTCSIRRIARVEPRRERHPQPAQHLPDARRPGARRQRVGEVPERGAGPLRPRRRRGLRAAPLAGVGQRARAATSSAKQRDLYKFLHDQTVRLMNHGYAGVGDRRAARLPEEPRLDLARARLLRHAEPQRASRCISATSAGTTRNPAHLNPLPPVERGAEVRRVHGRGGGGAAARAREDFARGEYRFVAEAMSHLVFADPTDAAARAARRRRARAARLRRGVGDLAQRLPAGRARAAAGARRRPARAPVSPDVVRAMSLDLFFDYLAVRIDGERAEGMRRRLNWVLPDPGAALRADPGQLRADLPRRPPAPRPDATVTLPRPTLTARAARGHAGGRDRSGAVRVDGDRATLVDLFALLDDFTLTFPVVEPRLDSAAPRP